MITLALLIALAGAVSDYDRRTVPSSSGTGLPEIAVVYSGAIDRVLTGLHFLTQDEISILFVSGIDENDAHTRRMITRYLAQKGMSPEDIGKDRLILRGKARNTLQNALETRCWLEQINRTGPILLITSESHMPRSSFATEQALQGRNILRMPLPERKGNLSTSILMNDEFHQYLATLVITQLPLRMWNLFSPEPAVSCAELR